jgi:hypothetical protein
MSDDREALRPRTEEELLAIIREAVTPPPLPADLDEMTLEERVADPLLSAGYEQSADALWKAALAAFNYVAYIQGVTGFQASWAELQFLARSRGIKGPFAILDSAQMLYPQYDLPAKVEQWFEEWRPWLAEEARRKIAEEEEKNPQGFGVHPNVWAHWQMLAAYQPEAVEESTP